MKIAVIGYSGSGKSTLSKRLGEHYGIPVLHLDCVHFLPGWVERDKEEEKRLINEYLNTHSDWVIDGNYSRSLFERRMEEADRIVFMNFNRFSCLRRAFIRRKTYQGRSRESITTGCDEKIDRAFFTWLIWSGRTKKRRQKFIAVLKKYPEKIIEIRNQKALDCFTETLM